MVSALLERLWDASDPCVYSMPSDKVNHGWEESGDKSSRHVGRGHALAAPRRCSLYSIL